jgi:hypothetical protein
MAITFDVAADVARKVARTRSILGSVSNEDLAACRTGYATLDNDSARTIVQLCDAEFAWREAHDG